MLCGVTCIEGSNPSFSDFKSALIVEVDFLMCMLIKILSLPGCIEVSVLRRADGAIILGNWCILTGHFV